MPLLYKYVPDAEIGWQDVWLGGLITAVLFTLGKTAIGFYLGQASVGSAYGAAGSLIALLVWVYYSALIMFFGAEFTHAWTIRHHEVTPEPHAIPGAAPQTKSEAATELKNCTVGKISTNASHTAPLPLPYGAPDPSALCPQPDSSASSVPALRHAVRR